MLPYRLRESGNYSWPGNPHSSRMIALAPNDDAYRLERIYAETNLGTVLMAQRKYQAAANAYQASLESIETLVAVEGHRWAIEDSFETAKNEFGLDHNESRSWHGWHRHVSMAMLAFAMMAAIRHRANPSSVKIFRSC